MIEPCYLNGVIHVCSDFCLQSVHLNLPKAYNGDVTSCFLYQCSSPN